MDAYRDRLSGGRFEQDARPRDLRSRVAFPAAGGKLLSDKRAKLGSRPTRLRKQVVRIRKRLNASLDCAFEPLGRVGLRELDHGLNGGQHVLRTVLGFAS